MVVDFYREVGYLPAALVNYLLLLGWSLDDKTEILDRETMFEHFSLERVGKASASFDPLKLLSFQEHYMRRLSEDETVAMVAPYLVAAGLVEEGAVPETRVRAIVRAAGDRLVVAGDILEYAEFFVDDAALAYDEAAFDKRLRQPEEAAGLLAAYRERLAATEPWTVASLEASLRDFVEERGLKLGAVIHALRVAVTGKSVGFGMFEILEILGREACLARIDRALARV